MLPCYSAGVRVTSCEWDMAAVLMNCFREGRESGVVSAAYNLGFGAVALW